MKLKTLAMAGVLEVQGKRALITGASHEVGFSAALALANHGCRLVLAGDASHLRHTSEQLVALGDSLHPITPRDIQVVDLDLQRCNRRQVDVAVEAAWRALGGLDLFVSCSWPSGELSDFLDTSEDQLEESVNVNFKSLCMISMAVGKLMQQAGTGGSIIFVTSIIGTERGLFPGVAVSGASLAAANYLTRAMAMELGKYKIRVNAIARGLTDSDAMLKPLSNDVRKKEGERVVPLRRWLDVKSDLTAMLLYLAGESSSFITGTVVFVDGGQSLVRPRMRSYL